MKRFLTTLIFLISTSSTATTLNIAVFSDHFSAITAKALNQCPLLSEIDVGENQMLAEYIIFCNALRLGNYSAHIELIPFPIAKRALGALKNGEVDATGFGVWKSEAQENKVTLTQALLSNGEFSKGLYTRKELSQKLNNKAQFNASELIAVANQNWTRDWAALKCTELNLLHVNQYSQMFYLVNIGRADVFPLTFSAKPNLERNVFGITLYPIKDIKIPIDDSLHFAIASKFDTSNELKQALDNGMALLRQKGEIRAVYLSLGITNSKVEDWQKLGCYQ